jgi:hypothetical protein
MQMAANPDRTPVAQDVFTWCTKEKTETWHVVRNHNAQGIVDRVVCKACGSEHRYKRAEAKPAASAAKRVVVRSASAGGGTRAAADASSMSSAMLEETWLKGLKKWGDKSVAPFDPATTFAAGEVLNHEVFGKGVVQSRRENKIDVLFRQGLKTLPSRPG